MKDRQFMMMLALVVAAGLVMGLIAFRMTGSGGATAAAGASTGNAATAAKPVNGASSDSDQPPQPAEPLQIADDDSGEPRTPKVEPPELKPPSSGDAPGTAAVEPPPAGAPAPSGDTIQ